MNVNHLNYLYSLKDDNDLEVEEIIYLSSEKKSKKMNK